MNIFMLHTDPAKAAQAHIDRHVVKMLIEYAQIMSSVHRFWTPADKINPILYRLTHKNHPSVKWASQSRAEYIWLRNLWEELHVEYKRRYGLHKTHGSFAKLYHYLYFPPNEMPNIHATEATVTPYMAKEFQAVGPDYKHINPVIAYRNYYRDTKTLDASGKPMAIWTNRGKPEWF